MNIAFNLNGTHLTRTDTNYLRANMTEEVIGTIIYDNSWELPLKVKISYDIYTEIIDVVNDDFTLPKLSTGVFGFNMVVMDKNHQSMNLFQPIGLPAKELAGGGGKYSKHLHYDIHLEGSWDPTNEIMTFDAATQNAIKVVLDKLDELTTGDNYDFLVNMRVAGKASAEGDIVAIGANMKITHVPGSQAAGRNLQAQFIVSIDDPNTAKIVITDNEFTSNNQMFRTFMTSVYTVFQFDINY